MSRCSRRRRQRPDPQELLAASLASCTAITMEMYARRKGWDIGHVEVEVQYSPAERGCPTRFELVLRLPDDLPAEQVERLQVIAAKCPVHRALDGEVMFTSAWSASTCRPSWALAGTGRRRDGRPTVERAWPREATGPPAAVLVPLFMSAGDEPHAVFTRRRHRPAQARRRDRFPGGRRDPADADLRVTALREAEEEIGLARGDVKLLGELAPTPTFVTNYVIHPFVGLIPRAGSGRYPPARWTRCWSCPCAPRGKQDAHTPGAARHLL